MTQRIASPSKTKEIVQKYHFYFKKGFGQNFLIDSNILENIADSAGIGSQDVVLEIGPGIGSLTQVLAERAEKVLAVEIDKNLVPILSETLADYHNIEIMNQDILKTDIHALLAEKAQGHITRVVANLPYYITTPIIMGLLEKKPGVASITVMIQKEVAQRLKAKAGEKDYGALSVAVAYYADAEIMLTVPPSCFMPQPKVASAVVTLRILEKPKVDTIDEGFFFHIVRCAFGQRRKTLLNCLINLGGLRLNKEELLQQFEKLQLNEKIRGEALTIEQFAALSNTLYPFKK